MALLENHVYTIITTIQNYFLLIIIFVHRNKCRRNIFKCWFYLKYWIAFNGIFFEMNVFESFRL